jgi:hypothetical protein
LGLVQSDIDQPFIEAEKVRNLFNQIKKMSFMSDVEYLLKTIFVVFCQKKWDWFKPSSMSELGGFVENLPPC